MNGAEVIAVPDGASAPAMVSRSTEEGEPFDAASVDMHTTCIDKTERICQLRPRHPSLQHIVMSGLEPEPDAMRGLHELGTLFLPKPFRLANAVERLLAT